MKVAVLILVVALVSTGEASFLSRNVLEQGLKSTFGSFFSLPRTISEAVEQNWILETSQPDDIPDIYQELVMYCYECEGPICLLFESSTGAVAGAQIGIDQATYTNYPFDLLENGFQLWTWTCGGVTRTNYINRMYFMGNEFLSKSSDDRISSFDSSIILQDGYVYTTGPCGDILATSSNGTTLRTTSVFTQQSCIYWMGTHYYYNMSKETECSSTTLYPWFTLIHGDDGYRQDLIGCAFVIFGKVTAQAGSRDWFEHPNKLAVKAIVRDGPECLYDLAENNGVITIHFYFVDKPRLIFC